MATPVLNNGIFLRDTNYQASSHVDSYHLVNMLKTAEPMDMGPVDLWAMTQKVEMPLYQMSSFGGKNVIMVDNARGEYKWQVPVAQDLPYLTEEVYLTNGAAGQTLTLPSPTGNNNWILIKNNSANSVTISAGSGNTIITVLGTTPGSITLLTNTVAMFISNGVSSFVQFI